MRVCLRVRTAGRGLADSDLRWQQNLVVGLCVLRGVRTVYLTTGVSAIFWVLIFLFLGAKAMRRDF